MHRLRLAQGLDTRIEYTQKRITNCLVIKGSCYMDLRLFWSYRLLEIRHKGVEHKINFENGRT